MQKILIYTCFLLALSFNSNAEYAEDAMQAIGLIKAACAGGQSVDITLNDDVLSLVNSNKSKSLSPNASHSNEIVEGLRDEHQVLVAGLYDPGQREVLNNKRFCIESHIDKIMNTMTELAMAQQQ